MSYIGLARKIKPPKRARRAVGRVTSNSACLLQTTVPKSLSDYVIARAREERRSVSEWMRNLVASHESSFRGDKSDSQRLLDLEEKVARLETTVQLQGGRF